MICQTGPQRLCLFLLAAAVALSGMVADSDSADAQGLLRRIQNRIQSRTAPAYQPRPTQPATRPPATRQAAPSPAQPRTPATIAPRRQVSPLAPAAAGGAAAGGAAAGGAAAGAGAAAVSDDAFGASILAAPGRDPSATAKPTDDPSGTEEASPKNNASIGISVYDPEDGTPGIQVARFRDDSLADDAGLRVGDIIYGVNGRAVQTSSDVANQLRSFAPGQRVALQVYRNRRPTSLRVPLVAREPAPNVNVLADETKPMISEAVPPEKSLGEFDVPKRDAAPTKKANTVAAAKPIVDDETGLINFGVVADDLRATRGAMVKKVLENSPAEAAGVKTGDRVVSINGRLLMDSNALVRQLDGRTEGDQVSIQVVRDAKLMVMDVQYDTPQANALAKSDATKNAKVTSEPGSITGGIGSMLGGLFGSKKAIPSADEDEMAFDDAEPIRPVTFEEVAKPAKSPAKPPAKSDPPSLDVMELPPGKTVKAVADEKSKAAENAAGNASADAARLELRKRIDELEAELNRLKAATE